MKRHPPAIRYHGSKWRIGPWILKHFPPHRIYVEAFGGGAAVLLQKPPSKIEVYNDLDDEVVNFFRVLRSEYQCRELCRLLDMTPYSRTEYNTAFQPHPDPVEAARRLVVKASMGFGSNPGTRRSRCGFRGADWSSRQANNLMWPKMPARLLQCHARFRGVVIEARPAIELLRSQDSPETLFYLDPPYVRHTRTSAADKSYRHDMTDQDHRDLATAASEVEGMVVVSGYHSPLYDELFAGWGRVETSAHTQGNARTRHRIEVLWLNAHCEERLRALELPTLAGAV